jgi:hypothetical protein
MTKENDKTDFKSDKKPEEKATVLAADASFGLLSEDDKKALRAKAREMAKKKAQEKQEDEFLALEVEKAEAEESERLGIVTNQEIIEYTINLGPSADHVRLNGRIYQHNSTYKLTKDVYDCIRDIEHRTWEHERVRLGDDENAYRLSGRSSLGGRRINTAGRHIGVVRA